MRRAVLVIHTRWVEDSLAHGTSPFLFHISQHQLQRYSLTLDALKGCLLRRSLAAEPGREDPLGPVL